MYESGLGVQKDQSQANQLYSDSVKWLLSYGVKSNDAISNYNLGWVYSAGKGIGVSDTDAVKWYQKAAEQGLAAAQYNLGLMYAEGKGVAQSDTDAVKWYQKAAEQGYANAKKALKRLKK